MSFETLLDIMRSMTHPQTKDTYSEDEIVDVAVQLSRHLLGIETIEIHPDYPELSLGFNLMPSPDNLDIMASKGVECFTRYERGSLSIVFRNKQTYNGLVRTIPIEVYDNLDLYDKAIAETIHSLEIH